MILGGIFGNTWGDISLWLTVIAAGLITFAIRFSIIGAWRHRQLPKTIKRLLTYVAPATLSAIILPNVLLVEGAANIMANPQIPAFIIAAAVAIFTRNVIATITAGMVVLWLVQLVL
ncbi:MAG: AzlD domain-containing protein [Candidatus Puniceispirillales bacterium WSBS_2018_MAG_OTU23]